MFIYILGLGVEFTYKNRHIISGKHAQELYADFYMPPKASEEGEGEAEAEGEGDGGTQTIKWKCKARIESPTPLRSASWI